jgi:TolB-like protein/Flp pilus assembly protein TadD
MSSEHSSDVKFEIGHVLFIDIVGYSKLLITEQSEQLQTLKEIVRGTEQFRLAEAEGKLLRLPTGDGGALVFRTSPEAPVLCAMEIAKSLKNYPKIRVRMGIHSGPVNEITDLNEQANIAGAGINLAQRVMDCGDAGHILLSRHVADDLENYPRWQPYLHDLGQFEVKHGVQVGIVSLYDDQIGNPLVPSKVQVLQKHRARARGTAIAVALLLFAGIIAAFIAVSKKSAKSILPVPEKSIAVLPFANLSEEKANAFFADGVQDEILTNLAKIADLKVISRTSVMQYKTGPQRNLLEIGQQLGVAHVVEGSVQRAGNRVRVNAQLIDARNDAHIWAQTYDRDLADVFAIQSEIAKAIADQLQAKLSPKEQAAIERRPTGDVEAFDLYTRAKNVFLTTPLSATRQGRYLEAIDQLNQALARDPSFLQAYCLLAHAHDDLYFFGIDHTPERLRQAETAVAAAMRLDSESGEAHLARAEHLYHGYRDYDGALAELRLAARTLPNDPRIFEWTAYILRRAGRQEDGLPYLQQALQLDPLNLYTVQQVALTYHTARRFPEAAAMWDRALALKPDQIETQVWRAQLELDWKADTRPLHQTIDQIRHREPAAIPRIANSMFLCALAERDVAAAETALQALGNNPFGYDQMLFNPRMNEGLIARLANNQEKARIAFGLAREQQQKVVQAQPEYGAAVCLLGVIDAALGRKEEALQEGRRAMELVPVAKDAFGGTYMIQYFAVIAAWVGDKDLALESLEQAVQLPSYTITTYGQLKLLPFWDPLRGDPRFEKTVASLAPTEKAENSKK